MPQSFKEVYDLYNQVSPDMSLPAFSSYANKLTGTDEFSEGQGNWFGNTLRKGSYWLDKGLEYTGLPEAFGGVTQNIGETLGVDPQGAYEVGRSLPRGFIDMAPMFIPGGAGVRAAGLAGAGAMSAFHTFGDTGSVGRSAVSAFTPFAMGKAGQLASEGLLASGLFKNPVTEMVEGSLMNTISGVGDKLMNYAGSEMAANAAGELINYSTEAIAQGTLNPYEGQSIGDKAFEMLVGNLPYMLGDAPHLLKKGAVAVGKPIFDKDQVDAIRAELPPPDISNVTPESSAEILARLNHAGLMADIDGMENPTEQAAAREIQQKKYDMEIAVIRAPKPLTAESSPLTKLRSLADMEQNQGLIDWATVAPELTGQMAEDGVTPIQPGPTDVPNWIKLKRAEVVGQMAPVTHEEVGTPEQLADIVDTTKTLKQLVKQDEQTAFNQANEEIPLGLLRAGKIDPSLAQMDEVSFKAHRKEKERIVRELETQWDNNGDLAENREFRKKLAAAQDEDSAAEVEKFRRSKENEFTGDLFNEFTKITQKLDDPSDKTAGHEDALKARVLFDIIKQKGVSDADIKEGQSYMDSPNLAGSADFREVLGYRAKKAKLWADFFNKQQDPNAPIDVESSVVSRGLNIEDYDTVRARLNEDLSDPDLTPLEIQDSIKNHVVTDYNETLRDQQEKLKVYTDTELIKGKDLSLPSSITNPETGTKSFVDEAAAQNFVQQMNQQDPNPNYHYDVRPRKGEIHVAKVFHTEEARETYRASRKAEKKAPVNPEIRSVAEEAVNVLSKPAETPNDKDTQRLIAKKLDDFIAANVDNFNLEDHQLAAIKSRAAEAGKKLGKDQAWVDQMVLTKLEDVLHEAQQNDSEGTFLFGAPAAEGGIVKATPSDLRSKVMPTNREVIDNLLRRSGHGEKEVKQFGDLMQSYMDQFNIPGLKLGEIYNEHNEAFVRGLAHVTKNSVWLAAFEKGGKSFTNARNLAAVFTHELTHVVKGMAMEGALKNHRAGRATQEIFAAITRDAEAATAEGRTNRFHDLAVEWAKTLPPAIRELPAIQDMLSSQNPEEIYANLGAMYSLSDFDRHEAVAFGTLLPAPMRKWVKELSSLAKNTFRMMDSIVFKDGEQALPTLKPTIKAMTEHFDTLMNAMRESEVRLNEYNRLAQLGRDSSWSDDQLWTITTKGATKLEHGWKIKDLNYVKKGEDKVKTNGRFTAAVNEALSTTGGLIARIPVLRRAGAAIFGASADRTKFTNQSMAPYVGGITESGGLSMSGPEAAKFGQVQFSQNEKLNKLISKIGQHMQLTPEMGFDLANYTKPGVVSDLGGVKTDLSQAVNALSPKEKEAMQHFFDASQIAHQKVGAQNIEAVHQTTRNYMMVMLSKALPREKWSQAPDLVQQLTDATDKAMALNPGEKLLGSQQLASLKATIANDGAFDSLLDTWVSTKADTQKLSELYARGKGHLSNIRTGKWQVEARDKTGGRISDLLKNREDYAEWKADKLKAGFTDFIAPVIVPEKLRVQSSDEVLQLLQAQQDKIAKSVDLWDVDPQIKEMMLRDTDILGGVSRLLASKDLSKTADMQGLSKGGRRLTHGTMDIVASQPEYFKLMAAHNSTKVARSRLAYELTNPELLNFPDDTARFKRQVDNFFTPDSELTRAILQMNATWHLGGSIPAVMTNVIQPMMTATSEAINSGVGMFKATALTASSIKDAGKIALHLLKHKVGIGKEHLALEALADPQERAMLKRLIEEGYLSIGANDLGDQTADSSIDLNFYSSNGRKIKAFERAKLMATQLKNWSMKGYQASEQHNMRASALLGWRVQKEIMGKNFDAKQAYEATKEFVRNTTYSGGRVNRPLLQGDHKAVGAMAYSLQGYTLGWLNQAARYIQHSQGPEYLNLTPTEKKNARRAAMHFFGTQLGAAGLMGMPFVGAALKLISEATGEDLTGDAYQMMADLLDEDDKEGGGTANVVMNGAANAMLANAGVPIDMGSRWAMSGVLGLNSYNGFDGDAVWGPTGGIISSALAGLKSAASGDLSGAVKGFSPTGVKKALQFMLNEGEVQTVEGNKVALDSAEKAAYVAGFNPQKLASLQRYRALEDSRQKADMTEDQQRTAHLLDVVKNDPEQAQAFLQKEVQQSGGTETARQIAMKVAKQAADAAFPVDVRTTMNKKSSAHLIDMARTLGVSIPEASLVAKREYANEILGMFGLKGVSVTPKLVQQQASWNQSLPTSPF